MFLYFSRNVGDDSSEWCILLKNYQDLVYNSRKLHKVANFPEPWRKKSRRIKYFSGDTYPTIHPSGHKYRSEPVY